MDGVRGTLPASRWVSGDKEGSAASGVKKAEEACPSSSLTHPHRPTDLVSSCSAGPRPVPANPACDQPSRLRCRRPRTPHAVNAHTIFESTFIGTHQHYKNLRMAIKRGYSMDGVGFLWLNSERSLVNITEHGGREQEMGNELVKARVGL